MPSEKASINEWMRISQTDEKYEMISQAVAIVTVGASGVGKVTAEALVTAGAKVSSHLGYLKVVHNLMINGTTIRLDGAVRF